MLFRIMLGYELELHRLETRPLSSHAPDPVSRAWQWPRGLARRRAQRKAGQTKLVQAFVRRLSRQES